EDGDEVGCSDPKDWSLSQQGSGKVRPAGRNDFSLRSACRGPNARRSKRYTAKLNRTAARTRVRYQPSGSQIASQESLFRSEGLLDRSASHVRQAMGLGAAFDSCRRIAD